MNDCVAYLLPLKSVDVKKANKSSRVPFLGQIFDIFRPVKVLFSLYYYTHLALTICFIGHISKIKILACILNNLIDNSNAWVTR